MTFKSGWLKLIISFIFVNTVEYRKIAGDAIGLVNVRNTYKLQSRSLLFPPTAPTRVQFIGGIGIPVEDLHFESVTSGYVLKAEYFLPETADVFRQKIKPHPIHRRRKSINETMFYYKETLNLPQNVKPEYRKNDQHQQHHVTFYRWIIYKAIEMMLNKSSLNGHACMLRSICEHASIPLNYEGGLLAEILHIILTPSSSRDKSVTPNHRTYIKAEISGRSGKDCEKVFSQCTKSPLEIISAVFET